MDGREDRFRYLSFNCLVSWCERRHGIELVTQRQSFRVRLSLSLARECTGSEAHNSFTN